MTREEELDWLCRLRSEIYVYMPKEWLIPMNNALDMAIKALEQRYQIVKDELGNEVLKPINEQEKVGHWILDETDNSITCDKCGCLIWANDISNGEAYYCPNCGARMESEEE